MIVAFHVYAFGIRGSEIAVYDYAHYNEEILGNKSIILVPEGYQEKMECNGELYHNCDIENRFRSRFPVYTYNSMNQLDEILLKNHCEVFYVLKSGEKDFINISACYYAVHCVFVANEFEKHGDSYVAISESVNGKNFCVNALNTNYKGPVVPHMVPCLPKLDENLREELKIPADAVVYGRHGGYETFDIKFVQQVVEKVSKEHPEIYFIFMNTKKFMEERSNVIFLPKCTNPEDKVRFINTCNAMLHGRSMGESFGLAIAEFSVLNKPVLTWKRPADQWCKEEHDNHINILGKKGLYYGNSKDLEMLLLIFKPQKGEFDCYSERYNCTEVMRLFDDNFLKPARVKSGKFRVKLMCNFADNRKLCEMWNKMSKGNFTWENIQMTWSDINIDYYVIINRPPDNEKYIQEKTIVFQMEPNADQLIHFNNWYTDREKFLYFGCHSKGRNNTEWHLSSTYNDLMKYIPIKSELLSAVDSGQYVYIGHRLRVDFIRYVKNQGYNIDLYGRSNPFNLEGHKGELKEHCKDDALYPYKYLFAAENSSIKNYITEKLYDGILAECLTFYWGCPNVDEYFDPRCYIRLDIENMEESLAKIDFYIKSDEWSKRIPIIRKEKRKILNYYSFYPRVQGIINLDNMDIRVINLKERVDKWEYMRNLLDPLCLKYERMDAVDKVRAVTEFTPFWSNSDPRTLQKSDGAKGCACSHYLLWKECVERDRPMLVFEDDIRLCDNFLDRLHNVCSVVKKNEWDVLFIGYHLHETNMLTYNVSVKDICMDDNLTVDLKVLYQRYPSMYDPYGYVGGGTFGYIVTPIGAKKLLKMARENGFIWPVDYDMLMASWKQKVVIHVCPKPLVFSDKAMEKSETSVQILMKIMDISREEAEKKVYNYESDIQIN